MTRALPEGGQGSLGDSLQATASQRSVYAPGETFRGRRAFGGCRLRLEELQLKGRMPERRRRRAELLVVGVTEDDLAAGSRSERERHPVALAIRRCYPGALVWVARRRGKAAKIWEYDAFVIHEGMWHHARFRLTNSGSAWCYVWAQGQPVGPGTIAARPAGPSWAHVQLGAPRVPPPPGTPRAAVHLPGAGERWRGDAALQEALGLPPLEREPRRKVMLGRREWRTQESAG